jgi:hypothetical protein
MEKKSMTIHNSKQNILSSSLVKFPNEITEINQLLTISWISDDDKDPIDRLHNQSYSWSVSSCNYLKLTWLQTFILIINDCVV